MQALTVAPELFGDEHPVALVTGAGNRRLGGQLAVALAARGYRLALHAHRSMEQVEQACREFQSQGTPAMAIQADIRDQATVRQMIDSVVGRYGRLDALLHTAASWAAQPLEKLTADAIRESFEVNTLGTLLCGQAAGLQMVQQSHGGSIVLFGDAATARPYAGFAAYFASKGAIETIARTLAVELAGRNRRVRVNAILPGPLQLPDDAPTAERPLAPAENLLQQAGTAEQVATAAMLLLENTQLTGLALPVDGGRALDSRRS